MHNPAPRNLLRLCRPHCPLFRKDPRGMNRSRHWIVPAGSRPSHSAMLGAISWISI